MTDPSSKKPSDEKPKARRFWKETSLRHSDEGIAITLDGRDVKTPSGSSLVISNPALAEAIMSEWEAQVEVIDPDSMPLFKFTVTAIDRVTPQRDDIVNELARYGANDLLCYREMDDHRLADHQHQVWQPYLDWMADTHGISLQVFSGIMPGDQSAEMKQAMTDTVAAFSDFYLSGLHTLVTVSGSLVLGLAALRNHQPIDKIYQAAFLDDLWQQDKWGYDADADLRLQNYHTLLKQAHRYIEMLKTNPGD